MSESVLLRSFDHFRSESKVSMMSFKRQLGALKFNELPAVIVQDFQGTSLPTCTSYLGGHVINFTNGAPPEVNHYRIDIKEMKIVARHQSPLDNVYNLFYYDNYAVAFSANGEINLLKVYPETFAMEVLGKVKAYWRGSHNYFYCNRFVHSANKENIYFLGKEENDPMMKIEVSELIKNYQAGYKPKVVLESLEILYDLSARRDGSVVVASVSHIYELRHPQHKFSISPPTYLFMKIAALKVGCFAAIPEQAHQKQTDYFLLSAKCKLLHSLRLTKDYDSRVHSIELIEKKSVTLAVASQFTSFITLLAIFRQKIYEVTEIKATSGWNFGTVFTDDLKVVTTPISGPPGLYKINLTLK